MFKKRRDKRVRQWNKAKIKPASNNLKFDGADGINAYTYDLSLGGARIYTPESYPIGTLVRIQIELARTGQSITIDSEVRWIKRNESENVYEVGVEFLHRIPQTMFALMKNLKDRSVGIPANISSEPKVALSA